MRNLGRCVWFQLKGIRATTMSAERLAAAERVTIAGLGVADVRYWFAHPEPVYLAVYLQALNQFLAEDIRDLVAQTASSQPHDQEGGGGAQPRTGRGAQGASRLCSAALRVSAAPARPLGFGASPSL